MPSNEELEDKIDSKYFEFLVNQKLNEAIHEKYTTYKGRIILILSIITLAMSYLGYDTTSTNKLLSENKEALDRLSDNIKVKEKELDRLIDSINTDFKLKSQDLDLYIKITENSLNSIGKQSTLLEKTIASSSKNLDGKGELFEKQADLMQKMMKDLLDEGLELDCISNFYTDQIDLLASQQSELNNRIAFADTSTALKRLSKVDSINQRINSLENEKSELFALHPGQTNQVSIKQTEYAILCNSIRLDESTIAVNGDTATLRKGIPHPLDSQQEGVFIVLVSSSRGGLLVKPIATYRVFVDHSQKNRWTSL